MQKALTQNEPAAASRAQRPDRGNRHGDCARHSGRCPRPARAGCQSRRSLQGQQEIAAALTGNYRAEHLFVLRQNFEAFESHQRQIAQCDKAIEAQLTSLAETRQPTSSEPPAARPRCKRSKNEPRVELRTPLHRITGGADLSQLDGIGPYGALQLIAEIGTDMSRWPTEKHFTSWLTLAPNNKISGGRLLCSKTQPSANR